MPQAPGDYRIVGAPVDIAGEHPDTKAIVNGKRVEAVHNESGAHAKVFVPNADYTGENVDALLRHEFRKHHRVMALGHDKTTEPE